jgi:hypothetical protein
MFRGKSRLEVASRFYGGGGGGSATQITPLAPADIRKFYQFQGNQFSGYFNNQPLLDTSKTNALQYNQQLNAPGGALAQLGEYNPMLGKLNTNMTNAFQGYNNRFNQAATNEQSIYDSGGQASQQELRNVDQGSLTGMSDTHSLGALGTQLLNRDQFTNARKQQALGNLEGITQLQSGLTGTQTGLSAALLGQQAGNLQQQQNMQSGGLNQMTGVQGAATGTFTQLMSPILQVPLANLQAQISQAQINEQAQQAGSSKQAGGIGAIGSVIGGVVAGL